MKIGDKVIKNINTWTVSDFDSWGRGIGIGEVVDINSNDTVDVRWKGGRCYEREEGLIIITRKLKLERILNIK